MCSSVPFRSLSTPTRKLEAAARYSTHRGGDPLLDTDLFERRTVFMCDTAILRFLDNLRAAKDDLAAERAVSFLAFSAFPYALHCLGSALITDADKPVLVLVTTLALGDVYCLSSSPSLRRISIDGLDAFYRSTKVVRAEDELAELFAISSVDEIDTFFSRTYFGGKIAKSSDSVLSI
ncbi:hypothetical protein HY990_06430 [Candidatus Micrarchaeota archaeon]|nr:hypothetical protein [Candidatus Micrarchaeota archaeon]